MEQGTLMDKRIETLVTFEDYDRAQHKLLSLQNVKVEERPIPYDWNEPASVETLYLRYYDTHLAKGQFALPVGAFKALDYFNGLSPQGFMLISSDKGSNSLEELSRRSKLEVVPHGSFSLDVNFHALSLYFEFLEGRSILQPYRDGIKTNLFFSKAAPTSILDQTYQNTCETLSPADYFYYHRQFRDSPFNLKTALTQFNLGHYDPYVLSLFIDKVTEGLQTCTSPALLAAYRAMIPKFERHIYPLPEGTDHYANLNLIKQLVETLPKVI
jgi:hypothetical protein